MIIHIAGSTGSGKSYIGNIFSEKINVIDLDDWTEQFSKLLGTKTKSKFIKFIDKQISKLNDKEINLLVGYLDYYVDNELIMYELETKYKFFIKIPIKQLSIQYNTRLLNWITKNKNIVNDMIKKYQNIYHYQFKSIEEIKSMYDNDVINYVKKYKYKFLTQKQIITIINKLINNFLQSV